MYTWEVREYGKFGGYTSRMVYEGESLLRAISLMREAKKTAEMVSLTWR